MKRITRYEIVAFITGFSLLAYELAAARILAPSIGSSTYVWTSVIGVIIAALSLGYAAGGLVADKRVKRSDIAWLLLMAASAVVFTLLLSDTVLEVATSNVSDPRLQGLLVATLLFSPASFLLGVISPYLARLRTISLETTGTSVAFLSAANAVGGIIGTFSVGFIFFGYIGSKETLLFTTLLLIFCSLLFAPYRQIVKRLGVGSLISLFVFISFYQVQAEGVVADIDTPSARYTVQDISYNSQPTRILVSGPRAAQSGVYLNGSSDLVFAYTQQMAVLVEQVQKKDRILILGGGAFTLPRYLAEKYPSSQIDVAEIDSKLVGVAKKYFNYRDRPNIRVYDEDARAFLNANTTKYDIILVDVYSDSAIPFSVATREYAAKLAASLESDGIVFSNIIGTDTERCRPLLRAIHGSYSASFRHYQLYPQGDRELALNQNIIFAYSNQPLLDDGALKRDLSGGMALTDNYAPVERLKLECQNSEY
ncbi:MAG TPA: fused MFS/spermidine synthase [Candidatus Saccharimonadia bacterium]